MFRRLSRLFRSANTSSQAQTEVEPHSQGRAPLPYRSALRPELENLEAREVPAGLPTVSVVVSTDGSQFDEHVVTSTGVWYRVAGTGFTGAPKVQFSGVSAVTAAYDLTGKEEIDVVLLDGSAFRLGAGFTNVTQVASAGSGLTSIGVTFTTNGAIRFYEYLNGSVAVQIDNSAPFVFLPPQATQSVSFAVSAAGIPVLDSVDANFKVNRILGGPLFPIALASPVDSDSVAFLGNVVVQGTAAQNFDMTGNVVSDTFNVYVGLGLFSTVTLT